MQRVQERMTQEWAVSSQTIPVLWGNLGQRVEDAHVF
jgi:hypothetical protein